MGGQARPGAGGGRRRRVGAPHSYHPPPRAGNRARRVGRDDTIALPKDAEVLDDIRAFRLEKGVAKIPDSACSRDARGAQ